MILPLDLRRDSPWSEGLRAWVSAEIAGQSVDMLFSTESVSMLPYAVIQAARDTAGLTTPCEQVESDHLVPELRIAEWVQRNIKVQLVSESGPALLGADLLATHAVHLRLADGIVEIDEPRPAGIAWLELERPGTTPYVDLRAGDVRTRACIATGTSVTLIDAEFAVTHPDLVRLEGPGDPAPGRMGTFTASKIGLVRLAPHRCALTNLRDLHASSEWPHQIVLGMTALLQGDWWFDFPGNAWGCTRKPEACP